MFGAEQENKGTSTWRWLGKQDIQRRGMRRDVERRRHAYIKYFSRLTECQVILVTSVMKHLWGIVSLRTTHQAFPIHTAPKFKPKGESRWREIWGKIRQGKPGCCLLLCRGYTASLQEDHSNQSICEQYPHWIGSGRIYKITSRGPIHCQWHCKLPVPTQCLPLTNISEQPTPQTSGLLCNFGPSVNTLRIHPS